MHLSTISEWLNYIGSVHKRDIELGLERIKIVGERLKLLSPQIPVIIVGGTNGKGSTVAGLKAIYRAADYHVGTFTSPYLFKHNEEVEIDGQMADDDAFIAAFAEIEKARQEITLTPFEFHTLAALLIFQQHNLDILILEIGLGGRLDAVNALNADVAIITSIAIDHIEWLGNTREAIGFEKAGIFREKKPAVYGDVDPPTSVLAHGKELNVPLYCQQRDFHFDDDDSKTWSWISRNMHYDKLPVNSLAKQNMSTVLMAVTLLQTQLPVEIDAIRRGLAGLHLPGRVQVIRKADKTIIFDVAHNPAACAHLASMLLRLQIKGKVLAVFSMLKDKDIRGSIHAIADVIDEWFIAPLTDKRAADIDTLMQAFCENGVKDGEVLHAFDSIENAYAAAIKKAKPDDCVLVFGSFHTVSKTVNLSSS